MTLYFVRKKAKGLFKVVNSEAMRNATPKSRLGRPKRKLFSICSREQFLVSGTTK